MKLLTVVKPDYRTTNVFSLKKKNPTSFPSIWDCA